MLKSRLYQVASSLEKDQLKVCQRYIRIHCRGNVEAVLFDHLVDCLNKKNTKKLSKQYITQKLFSASKKAKRLDNIFSDTTKLIERALVAEVFNGEQHTLQRWMLLAEIYRKASLVDRYTDIQSKIETLLATQTALGQSDYWERVQYFQSIYYHSTEKSYQAIRADALRAAQFNMRVLSVFSQLTANCELLARQHILSIQEPLYPVRVDEDIADIPVIRLYELLQRLLHHRSTTLLAQVEDFLFNNIHQIHSNDVAHCFTLLSNTYAFLMRQNEMSLFNRCLNFYKKGIAHHIISNRKSMSAILFNNIAALAEVCEDWAWGYDFIEKHQRFLAKKEREVTVKLAKAFLLAGQGKYREVISLLQGDKCVSMGDELKRRVQLICALVEVHGDDDSVWENINAFAQFLSTKKLLNSGITKGANNFLRILKYLLKGKQSKEAIHDELEKAEVIYKRSWLEKRLQIYRQKFLSP